MDDLAKRLRARDADDMMYFAPDTLCDEAADRIEQLERELADVSQRLFEEGEMHVAAQRDLAAEKALADMLYNGTDNIVDRAAYRKARGL